MRVRKYLLIGVTMIVLASCDTKFEPDLSGWKATTHPGRKVNVEIDGRDRTVNLPGDEHTTYRYAQWLQSKPEMLLLQITSNGTCNDYQIVTADTLGTITDTIYIAPPNRAINFKLAPNDSLLLLKSYFDDCTRSSDFIYTFMNRHTGETLADTIEVKDSRGVLFRETVWSPDAKRVIILDKAVGGVGAFVYDLVTKARIPVDIGGTFAWSPADNNVLAYSKTHSIYMWDLRTRESTLFYEGKSVKGVTDFRWSPDGDFLMLHVRGHWLNVDAGPFQNESVIYVSMKDKRVSETYYGMERVDTWK